MDKEEITAEAQRLGTYPVSIIPDQDCCTLFTPRHPATRARRSEVEAAEAALPIDEIVQRAPTRPSSSTSRSRCAATRAVHRSLPADIQYGSTAFTVRCRLRPRKRCTFRDDVEKIAMLTPGKLAGMKAVSDARGVIAAAAMDQRGSLQKALAKERGGDVGDREMEEFKALVTEVLTPHASAILLDPEWGLPASKRRAKNAGLLLAYEKTGYDKTRPGPPARPARRLVRAPPEGSRRRLPQDPALLHARRSAGRSTTTSTPGSSASATSAAPTTSRSSSSSSATRRALDEKGLEFAQKKPDIVIGSMREFSKDRYGVDVLKVEVPVNMKFVEGHEVVRRHRRPTRRKRRWTFFRRAADVATKPFIYLSAGVSNAEFTEALELAAEAGTRFSGVLCGRATWKDGIPIYAKQGADAFRKWLQNEGVKNIENVNAPPEAGAPVVRVLRCQVGRRAGRRDSEDA